MTRNSNVTRQQILTAADELFYADGFRNVSVDAIAERAGITKKTLYYHFHSKDELFAAYVDARGRPTLERYRKWAGTAGTVAERMERMFRQPARYIHNAKWKGCGFVRAATELANLPGHPAVQAAREHKMQFEKWLTEALAAEGRTNADILARQLMVLIDGAVTQMLLHRDPIYAEAAGLAAQAVLGT